MADFSDGLDTLRSVIGLREITSLIERTARWVVTEIVTGMIHHRISPHVAVGIGISTGTASSISYP